jgi:hypothetical protein
MRGSRYRGGGRYAEGQLFWRRGDAEERESAATTEEARVI